LLIDDNIVVTVGELRKGKLTDAHINSVREFTYIIQGECKFEQGAKTIFLKAGDSICHNAKLEHSVTTTEN
jgi:quercetin dioxygenase-like cupin family protein